MLRVVLGVLLLHVAASVSYSECADYGFSVGKVACSQCNSLFSVLGDDEIVKACRECCGPWRDSKANSYSRAVLQISTMFQVEGGVNEFLEKHAEPYTEADVLEVERAAFPVPAKLVFQGQVSKGAKAGAAAGKKGSSSGSTSLVVTTWKTEQISAALDHFLVPRQKDD